MTDKNSLLKSLFESERKLQAAQLASDTTALDNLIDDELIFTGPDGSTNTKTDDLDAHRNGLLRLQRTEQLDLQAKTFGSTGVTWVLMELEGINAAEEFTATLRYTRTWSHDNVDGWKIVAAHATVAAQA